MQRVSVVGNSGSGKSRLAREIAAALEVPCIELDAIFHQPNWVPKPAEEFLEEVTTLTSGEGWVADGNYRTVVVEGPVWDRADTIVWLRLPRPVVMRQVISRTIRRRVRREELWNGNREPWSNFWRWDSDADNIIRWAWTQHEKYERRFEAAQRDPKLSTTRFVVLESHTQSAAFVAGLLRP